MNHTGKILLFGGAGLVLLGLGLAARSANRTGDMLRVKLLPEKGELSLRRVVALLDAEIENPLPGALALSDPKVRFLVGGDERKRIEIPGKTLRIAPYSRMRLSDPQERGGLGQKVMLEVSTFEILSLFPELVAALRGGPAFELEAEVSFMVKAPHLPAIPRSESAILKIPK